MTTKYLILDATNFCYRAGFAVSLYNQKKENVSVVFGILNMIRSVLEEYNPLDCCACWDFHGSTAKEELFPEYKKNRQVRDENSQMIYSDIQRQIIEVQNILKWFGIKQFKFEGVEGDDVVALLASQLEKPIIVISSDRDMLQLVQKDVNVFYPPKDQLVTIENFEKIFGLKPDLYLYYRTIIGDTSDGIPGIKGFGEVTASKLLKKFGAWTDWFSEEGELNEEILKSMNKAQKITWVEEDGKEILVRNYQLMKMGYLVDEYKQKIMDEFRNQEVKFDDEAIKKYFLDNQFTHYLSRYSSWIHPFHMLYYARQKEEKKREN